MNTTICDDWADFRAEILKADVLEAPTRWGWRGMRDSSWGLTASLDRTFVSYPNTERRQLAESLGTRFREHALSRGMSPGLALPEVLAVGQHNGLPTRLLDWTRSPYIAAYFAFSSYQRSPSLPDHGATVAVWRLDLAHPRVQRRSGDVGVPEVEVFEAQAQTTPRLYAQRGLFTLNHLGGDLASILSDEGLLHKFVLPGTEADQALRDLWLMGVHDASMFPDLIGAAMAAIAEATREVPLKGKLT